MNNLAHGAFSTEIKGRVVHSYINTAFNLEGVTLYFSELFKHTESLNSWVLYTHTTPSLGATPEAVEVIIKNAHLLSGRGCLGVAFKVDSMFMKQLVDSIYAAVDIPNFNSSNCTEIDAFINKLLETP
jgi:hypothetical protein